MINFSFANTLKGMKGAKVTKKSFPQRFFAFFADKRF